MIRKRNPRKRVAFTSRNQNDKSMVAHKDDFLAFTEKLEKQNPGATIVLNAETHEVLIASNDPAEIAGKLKSFKDDIVTLFIGGPAREPVFSHHFCSHPHKA